MVYLELLGKLRSWGLASMALHPFVKRLDPPTEARRQNWERGLGGAHQVSVQLETWAANSFSSGFWHKRNNGEPLPKSIHYVCLCLRCHGLCHGIGFWWSPHLFSSLSAKLLPNSLLNWPRASCPHLYGGKFQSNSECASSQCFVNFFFLMGVLPSWNPNWILGDEMILLAPTTSRFLQTILCLPNEHSSPGAKEKSVPGPL